MMPDSSSEPDTGENPSGPGRGASTGTPRWVKVFAVVAALLVALFVVLVLTGRGGEHGPGRHAPGGDTTPSGHTGPPPGVTHPQP
jgi:hypothetical protein